MVKTISKILTPILLVAIASGCGGSSSSSEDEPAITTAPVIEEFTGQFIDSPVEGLRFRTDSQDSFTNSNGEFTYQLDEKVRFSIGDTELPEVNAQSIITPLDVFASDDAYQKEVSNLLRLLQSLDVDGNADNGITFADDIHELFTGVNLDFSAEDFEQQANNLLMQTTGVYQSLISEYDAIYHFDMSLVKVDEGEMSTCSNDHPMVGYTGSFTTYAHDVSGTATIIDNCTIEITNFNYDGGGPDVYVYAAINHNYEGNNAFIISNQINGTVYNDASLTLKLPNEKSLDDLNGISVWCEDFAVDFGSLTFSM